MTIEKRVRGRPFQPGNPGRPRGSKNRTTRLVEQILEGEAEAIGRKLVDLALAGDPRCLQLCFDRLLPRRNGRSIEFSLPPVKNIDDAVTAMAAISAAVSDGSITTEEATQLVAICTSYVKIVETREVLTRLDALESRLEKHI